MTESSLAAPLSLFARDGHLAALRDRSTADLRAALARVVPPGRLDLPLAGYRLSTLRFSPAAKLVAGLTPEHGVRTIGLRFFPAGVFDERLIKARSAEPRSVYALRDFQALAWVFPGERKLDLHTLADRAALARRLEGLLPFTLAAWRVAHYAPEQGLSLELDGHDDAGAPARCYLKLGDPSVGRRTAAFMAFARERLDGSGVALAEAAIWSPTTGLLQTALPRAEGCAPEDAALARALATFHALPPPSDVRAAAPDRVAVGGATRRLVASVFPELLPALDDTLAGVLAVSASEPSRRIVCLHADAHEGNLFALRDGRIGFIDLDTVRAGPAERDLANLQAARVAARLRGEASEPTDVERYAAFVESYNRHAVRPVPLEDAFAELAFELLARVGRAVRRGKVRDVAPLVALLAEARRAAGRARARAPRGGAFHAAARVVEEASHVSP